LVVLQPLFFMNFTCVFFFAPGNFVHNKQSSCRDLFSDETEQEILLWSKT